MKHGFFGFLCCFVNSENFATQKILQLKNLCKHLKGWHKHPIKQEFKEMVNQQNHFQEIPQNWFLIVIDFWYDIGQMMTELGIVLVHPICFRVLFCKQMYTLWQLLKWNADLLISTSKLDHLHIWYGNTNVTNMSSMKPYRTLNNYMGCARLSNN